MGKRTEGCPTVREAVGIRSVDRPRSWLERALGVGRTG